MKADYQQIIKTVYDNVLLKENKGKVPDYIPEIACIDENKFAISFIDLNGFTFGIGDFVKTFNHKDMFKDD